MPNAADFTSFTASVFPSQAAEVVVAKQPVLADYGRELRSAINQLPPEVTRSLMSEYGSTTPETVYAVEDAILVREFAYERAAQAVGLDQDWLKEASPAHTGIDESVIGADDPWNMDQ